MSTLTQSERNAKNAAVKKMSPCEKSAANPSSQKLAIAAYCYHICAEQKENNSHLTKREIADCQTLTCPLYPHRGWQKLKK